MLPIRTRLPNDSVGVAGVHHVCSLLSMRGLIAMPTIRNTPGIDILVIDPAAKASAYLQVKTSQRKVVFWPTPMPERIMRGPNFFCVFVRYVPTDKTFQVFIEDSDSVARVVAGNIREQERRGRRVFPHWTLPRGQDTQRNLEARWSTWRPRNPQNRRRP